MGRGSTQAPSQAQGAFQNSPTRLNCGVTPESGRQRPLLLPSRQLTLCRPAL